MRSATTSRGTKPLDLLLLLLLSPPLVTNFDLNIGYIKEMFKKLLILYLFYVKGPNVRFDLTNFPHNLDGLGTHISWGLMHFEHGHDRG